MDVGLSNYYTCLKLKILSIVKLYNYNISGSLVFRHFLNNTMNTSSDKFVVHLSTHKISMISESLLFLISASWRSVPADSPSCRCHILVGQANSPAHCTCLQLETRGSIKTSHWHNVRSTRSSISKELIY